jgi:hypothetical protein
LKKLVAELSEWTKNPKAMGILVITLTEVEEGVTARTLSISTPELDYPIHMALIEWSLEMMKTDATLSAEGDQSHAN